MWFGAAFLLLLLLLPLPLMVAMMGTIVIAAVANAAPRTHHRGLLLRQRQEERNCLMSSPHGMDDNVIRGPDPTSTGRFGECVSISQNGTIVAIGERHYNGEAGINTGLVQVYQMNNNDNETTWVRRGSSIEGENSYDQLFTNALSNDGTILAVGAYWNSDNGRSSGHVRVYKFSSAIGNWQQLGKTIVGLAAGDEFGWSVALSGDGTILAVGTDEGGLDEKGQVRVFHWNRSTWNMLGSSPINGQSSDDGFGYAIALSENGTILAVGAIFNDQNELNSGSVQVFEYYANNDNDNVDDWNQLGQTLHGDNARDEFGYSVSISSDGQTVAVGAKFANPNGMDDAGQVRVFRFDGLTSWTQLGNSINGNSMYEYVGNSVSLSGDASLLVISARGRDDINQRLQLWEFNGGSRTWQSIGSNSIGDRDVAVSRDGSTVIGGGEGAEDGDFVAMVLAVDSACRITIPTPPAPSPSRTPSPTQRPTTVLSSFPTERPTMAPTFFQSKLPTTAPTQSLPDGSPSRHPTPAPTRRPTPDLTSSSPSLLQPTNSPTPIPVLTTDHPTTTTTTALTIRPSPTILPLTSATSNTPTMLSTKNTQLPSSTPMDSPVPVAPAIAGQAVNETFPNLVLVFQGAAELSEIDLRRFETVTEEWYEDFFSNADWQQDVQDMKTHILVKEQVVAIKKGDIVNTMSYSQSLQYVTLNEVFGPLDYVIAPFLNLEANRAYTFSLKRDFEAFLRIETPLAAPELVVVDDETGVQTDDETDGTVETDMIEDGRQRRTPGLVVGVAVGGAVLGGFVVAGYLARRHCKTRRMEQRHDPTGLRPADESLNQPDPQTVIAQVAGVSDAPPHERNATSNPPLLSVARLPTSGDSAEDGLCPGRLHFKDQADDVTPTRGGQHRLADACVVGQGEDLPFIDVQFKDQTRNVAPKYLPEAKAVMKRPER